MFTKNFTHLGTAAESRRPIAQRARKLLVRSGLWLLSAPPLAFGCNAEAGNVANIQQATFGAEECLVSEHAIEHSCGHVTYGPFASVGAAPYPGPVFSTINTPHTAYTVTLPSAGSDYLGQVLYQPPTTGVFAFFLAPDVDLVLYPSSGPALEPLGEQPITTEECAGLSTAVVYQLDETETYSVVAGPTAGSSFLSIVEYLGTEPGCEDCEHIHLEASKTRRPRSREDAEVHLEHEAIFEVPEEIPVTSGSSIGTLAKFSFGHGSEVSHCLYLGGFGHPGTLQLLGCNHGYEAGSDAEGDFLALRVMTIGLGNSVALELEIQPEACEEHDHE